MLLLLAIFALAAAQSRISIVLHGSCTEGPNSTYECLANATSQQTVTLLSDDGGVFHTRQEFDTGSSASIAFKGNNPTPSTFVEVSFTWLLFLFFFFFFSSFFFSPPPPSSVRHLFGRR